MLGRHHSWIRELRALRRDPAVRRERGLFLAEGLHLAAEALTSGADVVAALASPELERHPEGPGLASRLAATGVELRRTSPEVLSGLQDARAPQPLMLLVRRPSPPGALPARGVVVVLDGIQDPGNLGTLIRTTDAAGGVAVVVCGGADPYHPRTVRATAGSIFRLPVHESGRVTALSELRAAGRPIWGTVPRGGRPPEEIPLSPDPALLFGGEGAGLPAGLLDGLDGTTSIPMRDGVESLSVGAAAAVVLFELRRRSIS